MLKKTFPKLDNKISSLQYWCIHSAQISYSGAQSPWQHTVIDNTHPMLTDLSSGALTNTCFVALSFLTRMLIQIPLEPFVLSVYFTVLVISVQSIACPVTTDLLFHFLQHLWTDTETKVNRWFVSPAGIWQPAWIFPTIFIQSSSHSVCMIPCIFVFFS